MELQADTLVANVQDCGISIGEDELRHASVVSKDVRHVMLEKVAQDDEYFSRLRQRDEPDLSLEDRIEMCGKLLDSNPGEFLARFESQLRDCDLSYFEQLTSDYVVGFRVADLRRKMCNRNGYLVRNRRFEAMRRLENSGEYFSDEEMKKRDPLLYEEMIGQFLAGDETNTMAQNEVSSNIQLSHLLLRHLQVMQNNELYQQQVENRESQMEEEEEEEDDDDDDEEVQDNEKNMPSNHEKTALRNEFLETMRQRFLSGKDIDIDYRDIDNNPEYDSVDQLNRDAEDKYFDEDDD